MSLVLSVNSLRILFSKEVSFGSGDLHTQRFQYQRVEERQTVDLAVDSSISVAREVGA